MLVKLPELEKDGHRLGRIKTEDLRLQLALLRETASLHLWVMKRLGTGTNHPSLPPLFFYSCLPMNLDNALGFINIDRQP